MKNKWRSLFQQKRRRKFLILVFAALFISGVLLLSTLMLAVVDTSILCSTTTSDNFNDFVQKKSAAAAATEQKEIILHYATSRIVPQQTNAEIRVSLDVLLSRSPCNFLIFGLGHDSQMWHSFNPRGTTLFLEEDPRWVQTILATAPFLHATTVKYRTKLSDAEMLLQSYRSEPDCIGRSRKKKLFLRGNEGCRLALYELPEEVYDKEWDLIMIDAPRGYFGDAPGRMAAIYSAAVMARNRKGSGTTHVFLHDVDRRVEKAFAEEFLCRKYLVKAEGRLWHFEIQSAANFTDSAAPAFC